MEPTAIYDELPLRITIQITNLGQGKKISNANYIHISNQLHFNLSLILAIDFLAAANEWTFH